jgi:hypothetical protein
VGGICEGNSEVGCRKGATSGDNHGGVNKRSVVMGDI